MLEKCLNGDVKRKSGINGEEIRQGEKKPVMASDERAISQGRDIEFNRELTYRKRWRDRIRGSETVYKQQECAVTTAVLLTAVSIDVQSTSAK